MSCRFEVALVPCSLVAVQVKVSAAPTSLCWTINVPVPAVRFTMRRLPAGWKSNVAPPASPLNIEQVKTTCSFTRGTGFETPYPKIFGS